MDRLNSLKRLAGFSLKKIPYSEKLIKDATNDTNWGPTTIELNKLSQLSCHDKDLQIINKVLNKELKSKNAIQILKALTIVHFILQTGSSKFYQCFKSNEVYTIKCLIEYQCNTNKNGGLNNACKNIRTKAIEIYKMLESKEYLMMKRLDFKKLRVNMKSPTPRSSLDLPPLNPALSTINRQSKSLDYNNSSRVIFFDEYSTQDSGDNDSVLLHNSGLNSNSINKNMLSNFSSDNGLGHFTDCSNSIIANDNYDNSYKLKKLDNIMETEEDDLSNCFGLSSAANTHKRSNSGFLRNTSSAPSKRQLSSNNPFRTMA